MSMLLDAISRTRADSGVPGEGCGVGSFRKPKRLPMRHSLALLLLAVAPFAGCASTSQRLTMPELAIVEEGRATPPRTSAVEPRLVPYPGLAVSYVENGDGDVYFCGERFYCYFDGEWFHAESMKGPWNFVEMKYVPGDLFRVRGHLPPALEQPLRAR